MAAIAAAAATLLRLHWKRIIHLSMAVRRRRGADPGGHKMPTAGRERAKTTSGRRRQTSSQISLRPSFEKSLISQSHGDAVM